jgi:hypothetical protein
MIARILRFASLAICLIALASFVTFAVDQTSRASTHQQVVVNEASPRSSATTTGKSGSVHKNVLQETIDKAFSTLSSPFSEVTAGSSSQWTTQVVDTLLVLLVYGFGLGFLARLLRVRL